jgi:AraC family transcriptional regulator
VTEASWLPVVDTAMLCPRSIPVERGTVELKRLDVTGFRVLEATFPPSLFLDSHFHEYGCMTVMLDGGFRERMPGRMLACQGGWVLVKPAGERHDDLFGSDGSRQIIIEPTLLDDDTFPEVADLFSTVSLTRNDVAIALGGRIRAELAMSDVGTKLSVEGLVLETIASVIRGRVPCDRAAPAWLVRACTMLRDNPVGEITVGQLAAEADVHPVYFARQFRRHYGVSVGAFARRQRLQWTARQLASSDRTLVEIALDAGFADQSHFTREFKRHFGIPPRRFRDATRPRAFE